MKKLSVSTTPAQRLWGWIYLALQLIVIPALLTLGNVYLQLELSDAELNFIFFCLNFICVTIIFHPFLIANGIRAIRAPQNIIYAALGAFAAYWILTYLVSGVIAAVYPDFFNVNDAAVATMVSDEYRLMLIGTVFLVPVTEELLYRGLIFAGLYNRSNILAYAVSTVAFALLHVFGYIGLYDPLHLLLCLLEYVPAGLCLGWAYAKADSIWAPILVHILVNLIGMLAMR